MAVTRAAKQDREDSRKVGGVPGQEEAINPALEQLSFLAGDWDMELSNAPFLPNPSDSIKGHVSCEWLEGGAFLVMRMGTRTPDAIWLIGRDESTGEYRVLYYDARRVSRIYEMSFSEGVWKMWRQSPGFWQRYEGQVSADDNTITARWEKSKDGLAWEHDFNITYTRVVVSGQ